MPRGMFLEVAEEGMQAHTPGMQHITQSPSQLRFDIHFGHNESSSEGCMSQPIRASETAGTSLKETHSS